MLFSEQLVRARAVATTRCIVLHAPFPAITLFFSVSDGKQRAQTIQVSSEAFDQAWTLGVVKLRKLMAKHKLQGRWLRVDWVSEAESLTWKALNARLSGIKRNYFRYGLSLDAGFKYAFMEQELNANAMLYLGKDEPNAALNVENFKAYAASRYGDVKKLDFVADDPVFVLSTCGVFCDSSSAVHELPGPGLDCGLRQMQPLAANDVADLVDRGANYLAAQVQKTGRFVYGYFPCFDRLIDHYNALRHASSTYAMVEAWELTHSAVLKKAIDRSINYLTQNLIKDVDLPGGKRAAFLVDTDGEIKLGGNAVCLLALVKYSEAAETRKFDALMDSLALGIAHMQDPASGKFVHVLSYPDLSVKEAFRIIYYDGEAAFGLMRLYGLTKDPRWLTMVEKAFEYFIEQKHWQSHDHWLGYCVNELTLYRPEERYFRFGLQNVAEHLDFVLERETTYPTLLELMMAAERMLQRIDGTPAVRHLLSEIDLEKFYRALHYRAHYLLNGHFWPELAMYFKNPARIVNSFFIRHHSFRVRIDDVEHYLSGFVAYYKFLKAGQKAVSAAIQAHALTKPSGPKVAFGGDVNLGRRQHLRSRELGNANALRGVTPLQEADLSIVNLECVIATRGEQGIPKGEGGPYYYRARPEMLELLKVAGVNLVVTANNHSGDYGAEALLEQIGYLDAMPILHAGSGANLQAASRPAFARAGEFTVAVFSIDATKPHFAAKPDSAGGWHMPLDKPELWRAELAPRIALAREQAHIVLVAVHWGENLEKTPGANEIAAGHAIIEAGADAVLGSSAHILQGVEVYQGRPIIHDAGDLLFDSVRKDFAASGVFTLALAHNGVTQVCFSPVKVGYGFSESATGAEATRITSNFIQACQIFHTPFELTQTGEAMLLLDGLPPRDVRPAGIAPPPQPAFTPPAALSMPLPAWTISEVPKDAQIAPLKLGPLTLLGYRVPASVNEMRRRQMLWVESYWTIDEPLSEDYLLDIQAKPIAEGSMPPFGLGMAHDPCDWMWPTSRCKPGVIYRDYYGLRPPLIEKMISMDFRLQFGVTGVEGQSWLHTMPERIRLRLPGSLYYQHEFASIINESKPGQCWNAAQLEAVTGGKWLVSPPADWYVNSVVRGRAHMAFLAGPTLYVASEYDALALHEGYTSKSSVRRDTHLGLAELAPRLAGAIVSRPVENLPPDFPVLQVKDPLRALIELGLAARQRFRGKVIAVTGTAGKSSVVTMLAQVLSRAKSVLASVDNYNSRVGVPAMLASLALDTDYCVLEIAQSALWMRRGSITHSVQPHVAIITEIGVSQTDNKLVKSVEDTAKWKSRIFHGLTGDAVAIFGAHLPCLDYVSTVAQRHAGTVMMVGDKPGAQARILSVVPGAEGSQISADIGGRRIDFFVPVPGEAAVRNAMVVMCAVSALGEDLQQAGERLKSYVSIEGRLNRFALQLPGGRVQVVDDSWNATVLSMENALRTFAPLTAVGDGRKIGVLGRIVHLGDAAEAMHQSLKESLMQSGCDLVVTHGDEMRFLREVLPGQLLGPHFSDAQALVNYLIKTLRDGDLLLIKGSRRDSDFGDVAGLLQNAAVDSSGASRTHE